MAKASCRYAGCILTAMIAYVDAVAPGSIFARQEAPAPALPRHREGREGTSTGINLAPGNDDDGWIVPPPVTLSDGTRLQLYKDGEALHAAFNAIRHPKRRICLEV